ncbi:hypothetical protein [Neorickettsia sp. 179522]|uniref:hypothetical protein n=1 Tax=Neorickettsia sp. 179522 TaxID=1714371 RepID=UPI001E43F5AC|nr:hypothetical protein [Neorickettsia sp. 179522]
MAFALVSRGLLVMLERHVRSVDSGLAALSRKESARMTKKSLKSVILPCVLGVLFLGFLIVAIVVDSVRDLSLTTQKVLAGVECSLLFFSLLLVVYQSFYAARAKKTVPTASPSDSPSDTVPLLTGDIRPSVGGSVMDVGLAIASRILDGASLSYCGRRLVDESSRSTLATNQFSFEGSDPFTPGANVIADLGINRVDNPEFEGVEVVLKVAHGDLEGMRRWAGDRPSSSLVEAEGPEQQALEGGCDESFMEVSDDVSLLSSL